MSPVIGMIGKKRSGKDSFASTLIEEYGFARFAFADPLKRAVLNLDPWIFVEADECYLFPRSLPCPAVLRLATIIQEIGWEDAKEIREVRCILQNFGTESIRTIQEDFWVRATLDPALRLAVEGTPVVITDCRYPNEADEVRDAGGTIVRVVRPGQKSDDTHASETALDDYEADFEVLNDRTLEDLANEARTVVREL